ncbi:hypothetical protein CYMTET_55239 [Cymbomonas tetramitiformis]|uniref:3'-5' exonuclease domain-containing protein n=1 Tax=Cymbomonas tetramitiformis TaxID=36881 RepID=A0AAE0BEU5_9CHLO|nr:hypothetical protein CYMTET_55239 [Cymbomonas tetramitiformis]|eukprot:gene3505-4405_t
MSAPQTIYLYHEVLYNVKCFLRSEDSTYNVELASIDDGVRDVTVSLPVTDVLMSKKTLKNHRELACSQLLVQLKAQALEYDSVESWLRSRKAERVQRKELESAEDRSNCTPWTSIPQLSALTVNHDVEVDLAVLLHGVLTVDVEFIPGSRPCGLSTVAFFDGSVVHVFTSRFLVEYPGMRERVAKYLKASSVLVFCDARQDLLVLHDFFGVDYKELSHDVQRCEPDFADNKRRSLQYLFGKYCCTDGERYAKDKDTSLSFVVRAGSLTEEQLSYCCADVYATYSVYLQQLSSK